MGKKYQFNGIEYLLKNDEYSIFDYELAKELITSYFNNYDYIFADLAYNKIRLKGFCNKKNKIYKENNDIDTLNNYIENYCAYNCKWFLLEKVQ